MTSTTPTPDPPRKVVLICSRIGGVEHIPPRTALGACNRCEVPVWITASALDVCRLAHAERVSLCSVCAERMQAILDRLPGTFA